jgi:DNA-binding beta-propeller fold protein YncE
VVNKGDRTLSIVDPETNRQIATVAEEGITGHEVAASADGRLAFVPIYGDSGVGQPGTDGRLIRVVDLDKRRIVDTIDFGRGVRPHCAVTCAATNRLYVTAENENAVAEIDPATGKVKGFIPTGKPASHMLAVSSDGQRGYTANVASGTVSVLDLAKRELLKVIPVSPSVQRISISPDDRLVFTADQSKPRLAVIDTASGEVKTFVDLPGQAYGTAVTPDGRGLVVALIQRNEVAYINLATMRLERVLRVPRAPQAVLVRPDGKVAYVSCDASRQVAVIDLQDWKLAALIDAGRGADGLAWAAGRSDDSALQGRLK